MSRGRSALAMTGPVSPTGLAGGGYFDGPALRRLSRKNSPVTVDPSERCICESKHRLKQMPHSAASSRADDNHPSLQRKDLPSPPGGVRDVESSLQYRVGRARMYRRSLSRCGRAKPKDPITHDRATATPSLLRALRGWAAQRCFAKVPPLDHMSVQQHERGRAIVLIPAHASEPYFLVCAGDCVLAAWLDPRDARAQS
jgi:hypothetical protein